MRQVGIAGGIELFAPSDAYFSYSNSPYIGHRQGTSIDIYPSHEEWRGPAFAPITGEIVQIKRFRMGREREFFTEDYDYAIGLRAEENSEVIVRLLHCEPTTEVGESIQRGEVLGELIRSRYFNYWTGPHYHVEAMDAKNFKRPSTSYQLDIPRHKWKLFERRPTSEIRMQIVDSSNDAVMAVSEELPICSAGDLYGHSVIMDDDSFGVIDAGVPHYKKGIIHSHSETESMTAKLWETSIGNMESARGHIQDITVFDSLRVYLDGNRVRGISFYVMTEAQLQYGLIPVKIIPQDYGALRNKYSSGDPCTLFLRS
jgi:hypothetical protein